MNNASASTSALLQRRKVLGPAYRLFYADPVQPQRALDVWIKDANGKKYLDAYNNVPVVGHCHPRVVSALTHQAELINTHTRYLHEGVVSYAERLLELFPAALDVAMFTCTGSEANDLALRIAMAATGRRGFIVTANAYHGVTAALADMSPSLQPVAAHVRVIQPPDPALLGSQDIAAAFATQVRAAAADLRAAGLAPAALLVDTVFASDGIYPEANGCLASAAEAIRAEGGLFIADEVQGGFGRIGHHWWAFQRDEVVPDIVTLGKPMGNGHPIGGVVLSSKLAEEFGKRCRYFNTFGGNTVSAAVGNAVLDTLHELKVTERVAQTGDYLHAGLFKLMAGHRNIHAIRGSGLYWGVEMAADPETGESGGVLALEIVNGLRENGVLVGSCGPEKNVLKIRPPLTFRPVHVDQLMAAIGQQLERIAVRPRAPEPSAPHPSALPTPASA